MQEIKRFSDLPKVPAFPDTQLVRIEEVMGKDIVVEDFMIYEGGYGRYAVIKFHYPNQQELFSTVTWSEVIINKLERADRENCLPLIGKIEKVKRYYDIK